MTTVYPLLTRSTHGLGRPLDVALCPLCQVSENTLPDPERRPPEELYRMVNELDVNIISVPVTCAAGHQWDLCIIVELKNKRVLLASMVHDADP
jgi:hypothetical protein